MSVIAYRAGILAADTQAQADDTITGYIDKIGRTADGWLWGFVGNTCFQAAFAAWAEKREGDPPDYDSNHSAMILISPTGDVKSWEGKGWLTLRPQEFSAWGSGSTVAFGAMCVGADPVTACQAACRFNAYCGGEVTSLALNADHTDTSEADGPEDAEGGFDIARYYEGLEAEPVAQVESWRQKRGLAK